MQLYGISRIRRVKIDPTSKTVRVLVECGGSIVACEGDELVIHEPLRHPAWPAEHEDFDTHVVVFPNVGDPFVAGRLVPP